MSELNPFVLSRRALIAGLLTSTASVGWAKAPDRSPRPKARGNKVYRQALGSSDNLVARSGLSGKVGFVVADARTGEIIENRKPLLAMPPASVTKAVTSIYALGALGPSYRFKSHILVTGPVENGKVMGDLYLIGGGDPTLDSDGLGAMARQLKEAGVREISGKFFVYAGALPYQEVIDRGQPDHLGYNPAVSGLNLNYNRVYFEWRREGSVYRTTMDARAVKYRPRVSTSKVKLVQRKSPVFTYSSTKTTEEWSVATSALGAKGGRWLPVRKPDLYAAEVFHTIARSFGIQLPEIRRAKVLPKGTVLVTLRSPELSKILRGMMRHSTNLTAESVGMMTSKKRGRSISGLKSSASAMSSWLKSTKGAKHAKFVDHSGLGEGSRISASDMVKVLHKVGWNGPLRALMKDIAIRGKDGKVIKGHPVKVRAKTGTLNFVSALAGYMETADGRKLVFAIFTSDLERRSKIKKSERERPKGAREWKRRSKGLQQALLQRWGAMGGA